jgi:hypothetical protein
MKKTIASWLASRAENTARRIRRDLRDHTRRELAAWCRAWSIRVGHPCIALYYPLRRSFVPSLLSAFPGAFRWPASRPPAWRKNNVDNPPSDAWRAMPRDADLWQFASRGTSVDGCTGSVDLDIARADRFAQMLRVGP